MRTHATALNTSRVRAKRLVNPTGHHLVVDSPRSDKQSIFLRMGSWRFYALLKGSTSALVLPLSTSCYRRITIEVGY